MQGQSAPDSRSCAPAGICPQIMAIHGRLLLWLGLRTAGERMVGNSSLAVRAVKRSGVHVPTSWGCLQGPSVLVLSHDPCPESKGGKTLGSLHSSSQGLIDRWKNARAGPIDTRFDPPGTGAILGKKSAAGSLHEPPRMPFAHAASLLSPRMSGFTSATGGKCVCESLVGSAERNWGQEVGAGFLLGRKEGGDGSASGYLLPLNPQSC